MLTKIAGRCVARGLTVALAGAVLWLVDAPRSAAWQEPIPGRSLSDLAGDRAAGRAPAPSESELAAARREVQKQHISAITDARTPPAKAAVARSLRKKAQAESLGSAARYALFERSAQTASAARDAVLAWEIWDELAAEFEVDVLPGKAAALNDSASTAKTPVAAGGMSHLWLTFVDQAVVADDYDQADKGIEKAEQWARKSGDKGLERKVARRRAALKPLSMAYAAVEPSREKLRSAPDDAVASYQWGRFLCLQKNDFERGLPLAARGEGAIAAAAKSDLSKPGAPSEQLALADAWWAISNSETDATGKKSAWGRAVLWYSRAAPRLVNLDKQRAEKRIAEYERDYPLAAPVAELVGGFTQADVVDCGEHTHACAMGGVDFTRSWTLALDVRITSLEPPMQMLMLWGDRRPGKDPFYLRIENKLMTAALGDARSDQGGALQALTPESAVGEWLKVQLDFEAHENRLRMFFNGKLAGDNKVPSPAVADQIMPWVYGGISENDHRFLGQIRNVRFANR